MQLARQSIDINATPEQVYAVIVDFENYPKFVPNQSDAKLISRDGERYRVDFELNAVRKVRYTLDLVGEPGRGLRWTLVEGQMMKGNEGGWRLETLPNGQCRAHYELGVALKGFVPDAISKALVERTLPENLAAFKREVERRG